MGTHYYSKSGNYIICPNDIARQPGKLRISVGMLQEEERGMTMMGRMDKVQHTVIWKRTYHPSRTKIWVVIKNSEE